jgi:serpin B
MSSDSTASAYAKGSNYQAVELPYSGGTTSMVIVLPDSGAYAAVEKGLGGTFYSAVTSALSTNYSITVDMPSFTFHGKTISLVPELQALGMTDAFELGKADFTAAVPAGDIYISDVVHQAFVDVDESGTEAAAATGVIGETGAVATQPPPAVTIDVDRTFFFFIRDSSTNTILFAGREDDPTAG